MKKIIFIAILLISRSVYGQLTVSILTPPSGLMDKQQLWNIIATNTETFSLQVQVQITFAEVNTGQPVFAASTSPFMISVGTTQLNANSVGAIQYNIVNPDYQVDPGPNGLLPVGTFSVCYSFLISKYDKVIQECQQINIPPLGPLLLNQPANASQLQDMHPVFSWLPPSPINSLNNLRYDFRLVEILNGQTGADAIKDNIPLFNTSSVLATNYPYSNGVPALEPGKNYAWQIIALNNLTVIAKSEVWTFSTMENAVIDQPHRYDQGFTKLKKEGTSDGYAVFWGRLRFNFFNESSDTTWKVEVKDLTASRHIAFLLPTDSLRFKPGQNIIDYDVSGDKRFIGGHQYRVRVVNRRNEVWQLRFEYRQPGKETNK